MKATLVGLLIALVPLPAFADGAVAMGCDQDGIGWIWGYSYSWSSRATAARVALQECGREGHAGCQIVNDDLNRLCFSLAIDQSKKCGIYGLAYYDTAARAKREAMSKCQEGGGTQCQLMFLKCDAGENAGGGGYTQPPPGNDWYYKQQQQEYWKKQNICNNPQVYGGTSQYYNTCR